MLEPGANRIEVMGDPGYMIFDRAWRTVGWKASELDVGAAWTGTPIPDSFWNYGTPLGVEVPSAGRDPIRDGTQAATPIFEQKFHERFGS
jgi:hypothetical protein